MAFRDLLDGVKNFFGPNNTFFNGAREDRAREEESGFYPQQNAQPAPAYQQGYQPQPSVYAASEQPAPQGDYAPTPQQAFTPYQQGYQPQQNAYAAPAAQQPIYQNQPLQQGYQPQQTANQPYVQPRNRRAAQHAQPQAPQSAENVVPFPASAQQNAPQQPAPQASSAAKQPAACVVNVRSIADCRNAIGILRTGDCVISVMDSIADQAEVRRYVDTLNGACFSLGCTMTRLSARVGVYLLAPVGMQVYTDQATTQMNAQSRAPQRRSVPAQPNYRVPYQTQQPQQPYAQQQPQGFGQAGGYQAQPYAQTFAAPQPAYPSQAPAFSAQQPAQGYTPDAEPAEFHDATM